MRQSVKGLIGIAIVSPVLAKLAEIVVEGTVLLRVKDDVIDGGIEGRGDGLVGSQSQSASGGRAGATAAAPAGWVCRA